MIEVPQVAAPTEQDYLDLERLSAKCGIPVPMTRLRLEVTNADGSQGQVYDERSHTWVRNFWNTIIAISSSFTSTGSTFGAGYLTIKDTGGSAKNPAWATNGTVAFTCIGLVSNSNFGILVGTGSTAESFEHVALVTPVAQGTGSGQMSHTAQTATSSSYNAGTKQWTMTLARVFNNNSGGTITVTETGIVYIVTGGYYVLFNRDLLGASVAVNNGAQLTVTYTMTLTFPA